jgi:hypothetical protein
MVTAAMTTERIKLRSIDPAERPNPSSFGIMSLIT